MVSDPARLDLRDLDLRGGQSVERVFPLELAPIVLGGETYRVVLEGDGVVVQVERVSGGFLLTVQLTARVYGACMRCLDELTLPVQVEEREFAPLRADEWGADEVSPFIDDLIVDVAGLAREALVLGLPDKLLCDEGCLGLCPQCGADLNEGPCACPPAVVDPRWEKLRDLGSESEPAGPGGADDPSGPARPA